MPKQVVLPVTTFWFNVSEHQAASPYLVCFEPITSLASNRIEVLFFRRVLLICNVCRNVVIILRQKERLH